MINKIETNEIIIEKFWKDLNENQKAHIPDLQGINFGNILIYGSLKKWQQNFKYSP
jgi:hypothetical protein